MKNVEQTAEELGIDFLFMVLCGVTIATILCLVIACIALDVLLWKANMQAFFYILLVLEVSIVGTVLWLVERFIEKGKADRKANEEKTISTVEPTTAKS